MSNTATVTPPAGVTDPDPADNSATDTDTLTPRADLSVTKTASPGPFTVGQQVTYTLTVTNLGPSVEPHVSLVDMLPPGLSFVSASVPPASQSGGVLNFQLGPLAVGDSVSVMVVVRVDAAGMVVNQATVSGSLPDVVTSNDVAGVTIAVTQTPPTVDSIRRLGFHAQRTLLVLSFSEPLDPARARDRGNYQLTLIAHGGRLQRSIRLTGAAYDAAANNAAVHTVTLHPARLLPLRFRYRLVVKGGSPSGVTNSSGVFMDGAGNGVPGSDYVRDFGRGILTGPNTPDSRRGHVLAHRTPPVRFPVTRAAHPASSGTHHSGRGSSSATQVGVGLHPSLVDATLEAFELRSRQ